jgi:SAM-dependent methyltransferase
MNQMKDWTDQQISSYYLGVEYSDYPEVFWERIYPQIADYVSIMDIGCGPGAFALRAARDGFKIYAVDANMKNLSALQQKSAALGFSNITAIFGDWKDVKVPQSDVTISAYSFGGFIGTAMGIQKIIQHTKEIAFFITTYQKVRTDFLSKGLYSKLEIDPPVFSTNYLDLLRIFEELEKPVSFEIIEHDFGIPLESKKEIKGCAHFLCEKLGIFAIDLMEKHLQRIITLRNGFYWVPNPRKSVMIIYERRKDNGK